MSDHRKRPKPYTLNHWVVGSILTRCGISPRADRRAITTGQKATDKFRDIATFRVYGNADFGVDPGIDRQPAAGLN
jgi:hypothetical protein